MKYKDISNRLQFFPCFPLGPSRDTEYTNDTNERIARETNATNVAMNAENNSTQIRLQQEMNEYNSLEQQLKRAQIAGVNPNAIISGSVNGNLQTSLPNTQAGHVDAWRAENPAQERLGTIEQIRGIVNDWFSRENLSANTEYVRSQATAQRINNDYLDDMNRMGLGLTRAQTRKLYKEIDTLGEQQVLMRRQSAEIDSKIKNMDENTRTAFLNNYFTDKANTGFIEYMRKEFDSQGIPRNKQLSDDALIAIRYGALTQYNLPMSELQTQRVQRADMRAGIRVKNAMRNLTNAQTKGQYIQNAYDQMFGWSERAGNLQEQDSRIEKNRADARKQRQNWSIDNWQTSTDVQTQRAYGVALDNMQTEANVDNTKADTNKKKVEAVETGTRAVKNLVDVIPGM